MSWQNVKDDAYANASVLWFLFHSLLMFVAAWWVWMGLRVTFLQEGGHTVSLSLHLMADLTIVPFAYILGGIPIWFKLKDATNHKRFRYGPIKMYDDEMLAFMEWGKERGWSENNTYESGLGGWDDNIGKKTGHNSKWWTPIRFSRAEDYMLVKLRFNFRLES